LFGESIRGYRERRHCRRNGRYQRARRIVSRKWRNVFEIFEFVSNLSLGQTSSGHLTQSLIAMLDGLFPLFEKARIIPLDVWNMSVQPARKFGH
jgi:hypothetical protein